MWAHGMVALCLVLAPPVVSAQQSRPSGIAQGGAAKRLPLPAEREKAALQEAKRLSQQAERYEKQGKADEAERSAARALALEEQIRGPWHLEIAKRLDHLADLYTAHHNATAAEPLYERARAIRERSLSTHPDIYERDGGELRVRRNQPAEKAAETLPATPPK